MTTLDRLGRVCSTVMFVRILWVVTWVTSLQAAEPPVPLYIQADYLERRPAEHSLRFQGSVDIKYGESRILADAVEVNTETGDGTAEGHVRFDDPHRQVTADRAEFNLFTEDRYPLSDGRIFRRQEFNASPGRGTPTSDILLRGRTFRQRDGSTLCASAAAA